MDNTQRTKDWYNKKADEYTKHVRDPKDSIYHSYYEKPAMYGLLPEDMTGMRVVSLGCGSGEDCLELARRGADVTGLDISEELIKKGSDAYPELDLRVGSMEDLSVLDDKSVDLHYSSLAVHYLDDWTVLLNEVARTLKPGGLFQFSMGHPASMGSGVRVVAGEELKGIFKSKTSNFFVGSYFSREEIEPSSGMAGLKVYAKTVQDIFDLSIDHGFSVQRIVEPKPLAEMEEVSSYDYEYLNVSPEFMIVALRKDN